jgi:predicted PurR-regulated permease PerM
MLSRDQIFSYFFVAVFLYLLFECGKILSPFFTPFLGAIVLCLIAYPIHRLIVQGIPRQGRNVQAALSTLVVMILIVGPFMMLCWLIYDESRALSGSLGGWGLTLQQLRHGQWLASIPFLTRLQEKLHQVFGLGRVDYEKIALGLAGDVFAWITERGQALAKNTIVAAIHLGIMVFLLFFLFRDGATYLDRLGRLIPMRGKDKEEIAYRLYGTLISIMRGVFLTTAFQTVCAGMGYLIAGIPSAVILALITGVAGFIPLVGTALVWGPAGAYYLLQGAVWKGIFILVWGAVFVAGLDHFIRPLFIRRQSHVPILFLFLGILGGAELYGVKGVLVGPVVMALIPVFIEIYERQYLRDSQTP